MQQIRDEALRQVEKQVSKFTRKQENTANNTSGTGTQAPEEEHPSPSIISRLESLRASSDEKLLSLLIVQRLDQLEVTVAEQKQEIAELKRRLELLERKDDERY